MDVATRLDGWTALFLATTVLTSVTAFFFPSTSFGPARVAGVLSLVVLAATIVVLYFFRLAGKIVRRMTSAVKDGDPARAEEVRSLQEDLG
jgi:hypothetical protein